MTMPGSDGLRETIDEAVGYFVHSPPIVDAVERAVRAWEAKRTSPATGELTFECRQCGTAARCPVRDGRMEIESIHGWAFPERLCPMCADLARANVVETVSPYPKAEEPQ